VQIIKDLISFRQETVGTNLIRKFLSLALIVSLLQFLSIYIAPNANAAYSVGSPTNTQKATQTGGGNQGLVDCSATKSNSVLFKISARNDSFDNPNTLTKLLGWCGQLNSNGLSALDRTSSSYTGSIPTVGGYGSNSGNADVYDTCGNDVIVGFVVYKSNNGFVSGIKLRCGVYPAGGSSYLLSGVIGVSTDTTETKTCSTGTVAIGLDLNFGAIIDQFGIRCGYISGASQSISISSLGTNSKSYPYSQALSMTTSGSSGSGSISYAIVSGGTASGCSLSNSTSSATISATSAGTCFVSATIASDSNYDAATSSTSTFTFSKATLNVTASSPSVTFGDPIPTISPTYSGFVNSENASSSSFSTGLTAPNCSTSYTTSSVPGSAPATSCSGGSATNYTFNFVSGSVIIVNPSSSDKDQALTLNGTNQYASTPDNSALDIAGNFSGEAWVYPTSSSASGTVFGKWSAYMLQAKNGFWYYWLQGTSSWTGINTGIPVVADQWNHVAITRAASSNQVKFYLNGKLVNTGTADSVGTGSINNSNAPLIVGSHNANAEYFQGSIDEVKIWNVVRSESDIQSDLKTYGGTLISGLVAYYDFNDLSSSIIFNRSSGGSTNLNLTTTGSPSISTSTIFETATVQAYTVIKFMRSYLVASGGYKFPETSTAFQYLIVGGGGGGGGGYNGGGGGAGGYRESTTVVNTSSPISVVVGQGGNGAVVGYGPSNGETSTIFGISSTGGGKGATEQQQMSGPYSGTSPDGTPSSGGSGGGGSHGATVTNTWGSSTSGAPGNVGIYTQPEGYAGGNGASGSGYYVGGGGGGASAAGSNATASINGLPGNGGAGVTTYITGTAINLAGGGAGAGRFVPSAVVVKHGTASHGGGSGACAAVPCATNTDTGTAGTVNTGGGGGAGASELGIARGGNGGSGFIVVRYITSKPTILTQPTSDTTTAGLVDTFTISTSDAPAPLTKTVQWQFTADTTTGITGWTNASTGSGFNTDTFTTTTLTKSMNKYRFRAIVTFSDTATFSVQETSSVVILTINDSITITSDTSTITRKYGDTQTVRTIVYSGGTTSAGAVGTSTSHTVNTPFGALANGKVYVDTSTSTAKFKVDTGTVVGTYYETVTVTDFKGAVSSYVQKIIVNPADTLTIQADTLTSISYGGTLTPTYTVSGLTNNDTLTSVSFGYVSCANGGTCSVGDIGPGGGVVFYVTAPTESQTAVSGITSGGIYLEAAPVGWANGISVQASETAGNTYLDPVVNWCNNTNSTTGATQTAIGQGAQNTSNISSNCSSGAGKMAADLTLNGKSDWYLPSRLEFLEMSNQYNLIGLNYGIADCFNKTCYWVSTEQAATSTLIYSFTNVPTNFSSYSKAISATVKIRVRPIRAFSPMIAGTETVTAGAPINAGTYQIRPTAITLANSVDTSNYVSVAFQSSPVTINRIAQSPKLSMKNAQSYFDTGTAILQLITSGGSGSGNIFYYVASGSASTCSISGSTLTIKSDGTCNVIGYKQASTNYFYDSATVVSIVFTKFSSHLPVQVQLYPNMIPLNGANSLETTTATIPNIDSITNSGGGAYIINGTGFTGVNRVVIGGTDVSISGSTSTTINITGAGALFGPLFVECSDGRMGPVPFYIFTP
jgi:hypothetical protein